MIEMVEIKCKICENSIRYISPKISFSGKHEVSCGVLGCMNLAIYETKKEAFDYVNILAGRPKGSIIKVRDRTWENKQTH